MQVVCAQPDRGVSAARTVAVAVPDVLRSSGGSFSATGSTDRRRDIDFFRLAIRQRHAAGFSDCIPPNLHSPGLVNQLASIGERVAVNDVPVVVTQGEIDRGHAHASQIDILTDKVPVGLDLCSRQQAFALNRNTDRSRCVVRRRPFFRPGGSSEPSLRKSAQASGTAPSRRM